MNTKNNQRSRNTVEQIIRSTYEIMIEENKPVSKITVREVCERVKINRSTFYAHFMDVYDVVEKVEHNMSEKMAISFFQELDHGKSLEACFVSMFRFVRKHRKFYQLYFDNAQRSNVIGISWEILRDRKESLSYNQFGYKNEEEMIYHEEFFIHGLSAMLRRWLKRDCPETPKEMYDCLKKQFTPWLE